MAQVMGAGCPAHPLRALNTQSLFDERSQRSGFPLHSPFAGGAPKLAVHGYCSDSQTSHGLMTLRRMEACSWDLSGKVGVWFGESLSREGRSV